MVESCEIFPCQGSTTSLSKQARFDQTLEKAKKKKPSCNIATTRKIATLGDISNTGSSAKRTKSPLSDRHRVQVLLESRDDEQTNPRQRWRPRSEERT
eukprot:CAMPEP_0194274942 /NCGR_PEP_ID=MMETSP0169-20130528/7899_1 /TAXON_ID=218684 /ORGANISM="Corethron pennatum, Strain L29A3" /LENGTH=97 /DNA_ID=CAMNT_0039018277 /DNA_START=158 /DNA_END=451 /DNA_ORIENTATION=-